MNKRLIIDSQLAAQDPAALFYQDWSWPVAQSTYDRLVTDVIEWSDELHSEISDSDRLLAAFLLVKADLLKDLSYYRKNFRLIKILRKAVTAELQRLGFEVFPSATNFLLVKPPKLSARTWLKKLREHKVLVRWFSGAEM